MMKHPLAFLRGALAVLACLFAAHLVAAGTAGTAPGEIRAVRLDFKSGETAANETLRSIFVRQLRERCPATVVFSGRAPLTVELAVEPGAAAESFTIQDRGPGTIRITGTDRLGLLYGVGQFLHTSGFSPTGFTPSAWRDSSSPKMSLRGIYFATHFFNYYHRAPLAEVKAYLEDMALWGYNVLFVWYDLNQYQDIHDSKAQAMLARLNALFETARGLGLRTGTGAVANEGYGSSPVALRAKDRTPEGKRIPNLGGELCPSQPGAMELILKWNKQKFDAFKAAGLDYYILVAYDNGGCTCEQCKDWGSNGYLRAAEPVARAFRRHFPAGKLILSTWYFDHYTQGEWQGITEKFKRQRPDWVDYIMVGGSGAKLPAYPLAHGAPGGFPMINFPEISMYQHSPWGGFGANPLPTHLQNQWDGTKDLLAGGFPYSEGIYEDMNKAICAQHYWNPARSSAEILAEYLAFNFSPAVVAPVSRALGILEQNMWRTREDKDGRARFVMKRTEGAAEAERLITEAEAQLPEATRTSWRWRIIRLRAFIDAELVRNDFFISDRCEAAFQELDALYHTEQAIEGVRPPVGLPR